MAVIHFIRQLGRKAVSKFELPETQNLLLQIVNFGQNYLLVFYLSIFLCVAKMKKVKRI